MKLKLQMCWTPLCPPQVASAQVFSHSIFIAELSRIMLKLLVSRTPLCRPQAAPMSRAQPTVIQAPEKTLRRLDTPLAPCIMSHVRASAQASAWALHAWSCGSEDANVRTC